RGRDCIPEVCARRALRDNGKDEARPTVSYLPPVGLGWPGPYLYGPGYPLNWRALQTTHGVAPQKSLPPCGWGLGEFRPAPSYLPPASVPRYPDSGEWLAVSL